MNLRKEIEKLILWYLSALVLAIPVGFILTYIAKGQTVGFMIAYVIMPLIFVAEHLENIVIAIWIYQIAKKNNQKYIIWALFGLVAHLFAAVIFITLNVLEGKLGFSTKKLEEVLDKPDL